jgi:pilus assembly protein FimV
MAVQRDKVITSAEKLVAKGKIEPAIKEYERLLDDNPNDVNTLNRIGDLWVRINRNDEAVKVFGKIADHYSKDGFFLKAIAIFKKINKLDPSKLEVYAKLADLYAKQGLAMEAKSQYQVLADYYLKHGETGNALKIYQKISELDPNSINVHVKLADLYSQTNQSAEALKEYDRVGKMLLKRGMLDEAVQVFRKALKVDSSNVELVDSLVTALLEAKDYDNASQIVQSALESNAGNPRFLALLGRIQLARGDANSARMYLEKAQSAAPDDPTIRETLADLYLKQGNADRALEMLTPVVEKALTRGERGAAVEMLNRVLRIDSGHAPTLERMVATYTRLNEETNILASMNSLAEAHMAKGRYEQASTVLEKLIQREPQNAQHRNKLQFVRTQMGGVDTMPARPKAAAAPIELPPMEIEEPPPAFELPDEEPELSFDLDASEPIDLDLTLEPEPEPVRPAPAPTPPPRPAAAPPPAPTPRPAPAPPTRLEPAVEIAAAELAEEAGDDLDFITEHLTEAEVFAKYGLAEKAAEHLRAVIERAPKHLPAHEKLFRILLDEGDVPAARTAANHYISLLDERGDRDAVDAVKNEFTTHGQSLVAPPPRTPTIERPLPKPAPSPPPDSVSAADLMDEEELSFDLDAGGETDLTLDLEPEPAPVAVAPEPQSEPEPVMDTAVEDTFELSLDESAPAFEEEPAFAAEPSAFDLGESTFDLGAEIGAGEPEPFFGVEAEGPPIEEIGEIDFYIEQELFDEARRKLSTLFASFPGNAELLIRQDRLERATAAAHAAAAAAAPAPAPAGRSHVPPVLTRDEIESELLSAIPDDDDFGEPAPPPSPPPPAAATAPPPPITAPAAEENLFSDEEDFFDLAAELESELEEDEEAIPLGEEEQSLEEIFKEFKKGVEQQLDSEDYDTHYNLGIAYKEMGLIDEAIGEFQLASKDPKRSVECASMLGLCFLEKGMPQLAIKWYRKGIEIPEITEEEHVGLLYDLGSAYVEVGDTDNAQKAFMEVYGMNTNYRDIVSRIKQLEDARK